MNCHKRAQGNAKKTRTGEKWVRLASAVASLWRDKENEHRRILYLSEGHTRDPNSRCSLRDMEIEWHRTDGCQRNARLKMEIDGKIGHPRDPIWQENQKGFYETPMPFGVRASPPPGKMILAMLQSFSHACRGR